MVDPEGGSLPASDAHGPVVPERDPRGANCGAIKNLALYAEVVHKDADEDEVIEILEEIGLETE